MSRNQTHIERTAKIATILCTPDAKVVEELSLCYMENAESLGKLEVFKFAMGEVFGEVSLDRDCSVTIRCTPRDSNHLAQKEFKLRLTEVDPGYCGDDEVSYLNPTTELLPNRATASGSVFPRQQRARVNVLQRCDTHGLRIDVFSVMLISKQLFDGTPTVVIAQQLRDGEERKFYFQAHT